MKSFFTNLKQRYNIRDYKISLVFLVTLISLVGILMVRSARPDLMNRQIMGVCLGLIVMFIISFIDYKWILNLYWPLYALNIVMLLAVLLFGTKVNGARRWLNLGFTQFQPSDLTKILMILFFAKFLMEREQKIKEPKTIIQAIALILPSLALIYKQPNLSTTICIAALFAVLLYLGGLSYKLIGTVLVITIPTIIILLVVAIQPNQPFLKDYQQERILAWLEPEKYADDESYQQLNSVMAIGGGQLLGKGLNNSTYESVKNGNFLSEEQCDFIFAVVGEELGFAGSAFIILIYLLLFIEGLRVAGRSPDLEGKLLASGFVTILLIQCFINMGVAMLLLPNTGTPLPFISAGMSSLISTYIMMGIMLNISMHRKMKVF